MYAYAYVVHVHACVLLYVCRRAQACAYTISHWLVLWLCLKQCVVAEAIVSTFALAGWMIPVATLLIILVATIFPPPEFARLSFLPP